VPAVSNIVRALPADATGHVLLEVPHPDDRFDLGGPAGVRVSWAPRGSAGHGTRLLSMVGAADLPRARPVDAREDATQPDDAAAEQLLWDVPEPTALPEPRSERGAHRLYAWVAGEAATVRAIRRHLVNERGHDRRSVAFMGYWRMGRTEC